ncbi:hypothetical protein [Aureliella helgolandensis]|nr:hypothetical protein [Aureliella helgolandensis]
MPDTIPRLLARFEVKDNNGNDYILSHYVTSTQVGMSKGMYRRDPLQYFLTEDRQLVRWVAEGRFEICSNANTELFSSDYQAP